MGVENTTHEEFCGRVSNLTNQLSKRATHHSMAKNLLQNLNKARDDSAYRSTLHTTVKQELSLLNEISSTLRKQHERENMNKMRANFQKLLATNPRAAHRCINKKKGSNTDVDETVETVQPHTAIKDPATGHIKRDGTGMLRAFQNYTTGLLKSRFGTKTGRYKTGTEPRDYPWAREGAIDPFALTSPGADTKEDASPLEDIMDYTKFETQLRHLPNNKQAGPDEVINEALKTAPESLKQATFEIQIICWILQYTPEQWKESYTVELPKEGKDHSEPVNYRPVGLASTVYKLWTSTVTRVISQYAEKRNMHKYITRGIQKTEEHPQTMP